MTRLLCTPGYYATPFTISPITPLAARIGESTDFLPSGFLVEIVWSQDAIGQVSWCEIALATATPAHGDPSLSVAGWKPITADMQTQADGPITTTVTLDRDIPPGLALYLIVAGDFGETRPGLGGANVRDQLGTGAIAVYTGSAPYRPSELVGQPVTFAASKTACPIRASVLLP